MTSTTKRTFLGADTFAVFMLIGVGAALRFWSIGSKSIWLDEAWSIWLANQPLWDGLTWLTQIGFNPPLYLICLSTWQSILGDGEAAVRMLSALFSTAAIPFVYGIAKRISADRLVAFVAALLFVVSSYHIHYAQEARMYGLLVLVAAISIFFAVTYLDASRERQLTWRDWLFPQRWREPDVVAAVGLSVSQAAVMLTHNTATVFFPLALNSAVLGSWLYRRICDRQVSIAALNGDHFFGNWVKIQVATLLLWSPWAIPFILQVLRTDTTFWLQPPTVSTLIMAVNNFSFFHIPHEIPTSLILVLHAALALLGIYSLRHRFAWAFLLLALMAVPFFGEVLISYRRPIFLDRTLIWITIGYFVLVAIGVRSLLGDGQSSNVAVNFARRAAAIVAVIAIVSYNIIALQNYYMNFVKEGWDTAAAYIAERIGDNEKILFHSSIAQLPFEYYFRKYDLDVEFRGVPLDLFESGETEPAITAENISSIDALIENESKVWLIYSHALTSDPEQSVLNRFRPDWDETSRTEFKGIQIFEYTKKGSRLR